MHYVLLELGIQTIHNRSLDWMNRGHHYEIVPDAVRRCRQRGFDIGAHMILGFRENPAKMCCRPRGR